MKLSELSTDRALDVLCELTPHIGNIVSDADLAAAVGEVVNFDSENTNNYGLVLIAIDKINQILPLVLKNHRAEVYGILSTINEKSVEEIAAQNSILTLCQIRELFQDRALIDFFKSFRAQEQTGQSLHSADSPASE